MQEESPLRRVAHVLVGALGLVALAAIPTGSNASGAGPLAGPYPSPSPRPAPSPSSGPAPRVAVLIMENKEYSSVIGNPKAPYVNGLAAKYGLAKQFYAVSHPSLPNYLALTGGSTFGITSDCTDCPVRATNLVDQLEAAGITWKAYMEGVPSPCFKGSEHGGYAKKHDPFMYYVDIASSPKRCKHVVSFSGLRMDLATATLPGFSWITPDLCHDTHNCPVATGDAFLGSLVPEILKALGPSGVLILTWDEGSTSAGCCEKAAGGHVATIVAGPGAASGAVSVVPYDHYSILATVERVLGLPALRNAGCTCTRPMTDLLAAGG